MSGRLVVMVSGNGSNLQALIDATRSGRLDAEIVAVVSNRSDAYGLVRAARAGITTETVERRAGDEDRAGYDRRLAEVVASHRPDLVVMAGWMRIVTMAFLQRFAVVNLHPALPGAFPGVDAISRTFAAWRAGDTALAGVMVHWVPDEGVDTGPVIATQPVAFVDGETLDDFETRMHAAEHELIVEAVGLALAEVAGAESRAVSMTSEPERTP